MILQRYTFGSKSQPGRKPLNKKAVLLMILQRYTFGSKSQRLIIFDFCTCRCLWYCKDIHLEANHNADVADKCFTGLLMILQRYTFGSKSQPKKEQCTLSLSCLWYCKDIHLEANHNVTQTSGTTVTVAYDIAKIYIWKQITTPAVNLTTASSLLMILQRYTFGSKSQLF